MKNKYSDGSEIQVGDIFTDGGQGRENTRLMYRAKVLYVDQHTLVWIPLNELTGLNKGYKSCTWPLTSFPKKIDISDLNPEELNIYNNSDKYLQKI